ncbi:helix-turn-helix domain-containing protein [Bacillus cereus]|nr:helix-turn-helix domain-containing protein [Bacillus cereus]
MGENIFKKLVDDSNVRLSEISRVTKINRSTLNNYFRGDSIPKLENAQKLANFFGVSVSDVMGLDSAKEEIDDVKKALEVLNSASEKVKNNKQYQELIKKFESYETQVTNLAKLEEATSEKLEELNKLQVEVLQTEIDNLMFSFLNLSENNRNKVQEYAELLLISQAESIKKNK